MRIMRIIRIICIIRIIRIIRIIETFTIRRKDISLKYKYEEKYILKF